MILQLNFPVVREEPSRDEIVIVGIEEVVAAPGLVSEAVGEILVLENLGAICHGASGEAWQSTINPIARCAIEVSPDEVDCP